LLAILALGSVIAMGGACERKSGETRRAVMGTSDVPAVPPGITMPDDCHVALAIDVPNLIGNKDFDVTTIPPPRGWPPWSAISGLEYVEFCADRTLRDFVLFVRGPITPASDGKIASTANLIIRQLDSNTLIVGSNEMLLSAGLEFWRKRTRLINASGAFTAAASVSPSVLKRDRPGPISIVGVRSFSRMTMLVTGSNPTLLSFELRYRERGDAESVYAELSKILATARGGETDVYLSKFKVSAEVGLLAREVLKRVDLKINDTRVVISAGITGRLLTHLLVRAPLPTSATHRRATVQIEP
jgi:hypothetical protein